VSAFSDNYQRLARDLFGLSSLWLGDGHLVYVKGKGFLLPFAEEYKRFRLSEIEAVTVARTSRIGFILLYLFGLLLAGLIVALIFLLADTMRPITVVALSIGFTIGLVSLALLLRHLILGPTCVCDIQTRLSRERIRPLSRYHRTLETLQRIDGLVRESQAKVPVGGEQKQPSGGAKREGGRRLEFFQIPSVVPVTYGIFVILGLAGLTSLLLESVVLSGIVLFLILAASLAVTLALIAVVRQPTPESLRTVLWLLLGCHFLAMGVGVVYYLVVAMREPSYTLGVTGPLEAFTAIASEGGMLLYGVFAGLFIGMTVAAAAGWVLIGGWRKKLRIAAGMAGSEEGSGKAPAGE